MAACGGGASQSTGLRIETLALPPAEVGRAYGVEVRAAGGSGTGNTWRISSGDLPPGMTFTLGRICPTWSGWTTPGEIPTDGSTGERTEISGIAASRRNPGIFWIHDDSGAEAVLYVVFRTYARAYVLPALYTTTEQTILQPASGVPLHVTRADPTDLPGTLRGAPTTPGTWTIPVEVEDGSGARAARTFDLEVRQP